MATDLSTIFAWLAGQSLVDAPMEQVVQGLGERLNEAGLAVARAHVSTTTLHPHINSFMVEWRPGVPAARLEFPHGQEVSRGWLESPLRHMIENRLPLMRQRLDRSNAEFAFPVFAEFAAEGMTEWVAFREGFEWTSSLAPGGQFGLVASLTTRREGGFPEDAGASLLAMVKPLAAAVKSRFVTTIARDVLAAYLGADAAARVLAGDIVRGGVTVLPAVVMISDIKGFTRLSNTAPIADVVAHLNDCLGRIAAAVARHGGEILKFMGDGALAIFLLKDRAAADVASDALAAAVEIQTSRAPSVGIAVGLNLGDVHYGNIGAAGRLDFTAIGPAVNEAARLEALCGALGENILVSGALAAAAPAAWRARLQPLGRHVLKGFDEPREVFSI